MAEEDPNIIGRYKLSDEKKKESDQSEIVGRYTLKPKKTDAPVPVPVSEPVDPSAEIPNTLEAIPGYLAARDRILKEAPILPQAQPGKHAISGFTKIATGAPSFLGMGGAALEALATGASPEIAGYSTGDAPSDKSFGERYDEAAKEGIDADLMQAGKTGREWVYGQLGIGEPKYTSEKIADLAGTLTPIPAAWIAPAVTGAKKFGNLVKGGFYLTTPLVQGGPGFAKRALAQFGFGAGVDQSVTALQGKPLWFSDTLDETPELEKNVAETDPNVVGRYKLVSDDGTIKSVATSQVTSQQPPMTNAEALAVAREWHEKVEREEHWKDKETYALIIAALLLGSGSARYALKKSKPENQTTGQFLHEKMSDKASAIRNSLENLGFNQQTIARVVANAHTDTLDLANNFIRTGRLGQDFVVPHGKRAHAPIMLRARLKRLPETDRDLYNEAMGAYAEKVARKGSDDPSTLWQSGRRSTDELDKIIARANANPEIKQLMKDTHETFEVLLDYTVHRGVHTSGPKGTATAFKASNTLDGRVVYMPAYDKVKRTFAEKLSKTLLGQHTKQGRQASVQAEYGARADDIDFTQDKFSPLEALERYSIAVIKDSNEQSYKGGLLDALSGITRRGDEVSRTVTEAGAPGLRARDTVYLGKADDLSNIDSIPFIPYTKDRAAESILKGFSGSIEDLKARFPEGEIVTVHQGGELRVYRVKDKGLQAALDLSPQITNPIIQFANHYKNIFTRFTTGNLSLFAPVSGLYSTQQVAINTFAKQGVWRGITSPFVSLTSTGRLFLTNASGDLSKYLANRVGTVVEGMPSNAAQRLTERLNTIFINSKLVNARTETGRQVSSTYSAINDGTMPEIMDGVVKKSAKYFGDEVGLMADLWRSWNNAWHEGPAYGAYLRALGDEITAAQKAGKTISPKEMSQIERNSVEVSKSLAGDMRRVGASGFARVFQQTFPFGSAMIQSWNSIGAAAKANPARFMIGASSLIGVPTASELVYNKNLSDSHVDENGQPITFSDPDNPNKQWTYNDYYWNGFSTEQRVNNFIYFQPGEPPWEAIIVPVSPEWTMFRATTIEAMDAIFNFSDVGNIGKVREAGADLKRNHIFKSLAKVLDIALPPVLSAAGSAVDVDLRLGLSVEKKADPTDPGTKAEIIRTSPLMKGERLTSRTSEGLHVDSHMSRKLMNIIQDIFGAAGTQYIMVHEAFLAGKAQKTGGTVKGFLQTGGWQRGLDQALQQLGTGAKQQMRYGQGLVFDKVLRPSKSDEISQTVFAVEKNLQHMTTNWREVIQSRGLILSDGKPISGDALQRVVTDDPVYQFAAASAQQFLGDFKENNAEIRSLEKQLSILPNSRVGEGTEFPTLQDRRNKEDSIKLQIQAINAKKMVQIEGFNKELEHWLEKILGMPIEIDLTKLGPRPQVPGPRSMMQERGIGPQTSQSP